MVNLFKLLLTSAGILSVISLLKQNYSIHSESQPLSDSDLILTLSLPGIIIYQQNELMTWGSGNTNCSWYPNL